LKQLTGGLTAGVILIDLAGSVIWANEAALAMHGLDTVAALGAAVDDYAQLFTLSLRNGLRLNSREYPLMRLLAGENFPDLVVEVATPSSSFLPGSRSKSGTTNACSSPSPTSNPVARPSARCVAARHISRLCSRWHRSPLALTSADGYRLIEGNDAFWRLTGYTATNFVGRPAGDPELWADVADRNAAEQEIERGGGVRGRDVRLLDAVGHEVDCLLSAERMTIRDETCTLWLFQTSRRAGAASSSWSMRSKR
jgi:PAS domain-containing protein